MSHALQQKPKVIQRYRTASKMPGRHGCDMMRPQNGPVAAPRAARPFLVQSVSFGRAGFGGTELQRPPGGAVIAWPSCRRGAWYCPAHP